MRYLLITIPILISKVGIGQETYGWYNPFLNGCYDTYSPPGATTVHVDNNTAFFFVNDCLYFDENVECSSGKKDLDINSTDLKTIYSNGGSIRLHPGTTITPSSEPTRIISIEESCHKNVYEVSGLPSVSNPLEKSGWNLVFNDEFEGTELDTSKWRCDVGPSPSAANGPAWFTEEPGRTYSEYNTDLSHGNITVANGELSIKAINETYQGSWPVWDPIYTYTFSTTSGRIVSKEEFHYGYYEARMKIPTGDIHWPAFWTFTSPWQEIDIMENVGSEHGVNKIGTNFHYIGDQSVDSRLDQYQVTDRDGDGVIDDELIVDYPASIELDPAYDISQDWITVGCLYEPGKVSIYVNNQLARVFRCMFDYPSISVDNGGIDSPMHVIFNLAMHTGDQTAYDNLVTSGDLSQPFIIDYFRYYTSNDIDFIAHQGGYDHILSGDINSSDQNDMDELVFVNTNYQNGGIRTYDALNDQILNTFQYSLHPEYDQFLDSEDEFLMYQDASGDKNLLIINKDGENTLLTVDLSNGNQIDKFHYDNRFLNFLESDDKFFVANYDGDVLGKDELIMVNTSAEPWEDVIKIINIDNGEVIKSINNYDYTHNSSPGLWEWLDPNDKLFVKDVNNDGKSEELVIVNSESVSGVNEHIRVYNMASESYDFTDLLNSHLVNWILPDDNISIGNIDNADDNWEVVVVKKDVNASVIIKAIDLTTGTLDASVAYDAQLGDFLDYCDVVKLTNVRGDSDDELVFVNTNGDPSTGQKTIQIYDFDVPNLSQTFPFTTFSNENYNMFLNESNSWPFEGDRIMVADINQGTTVSRKNLLFINTMSHVDPQYNYFGLAKLDANNLTRQMEYISNGIPSPNNSSQFQHQYTEWVEGIDPYLSICSGHNSIYNKSADQVEEIIEESSLLYKIYPNPTNNNLFIDFESLDSRVTISLYNSVGQQVGQIQNTEEPRLMVDLSNLSSGVYLIKIEDLTNKEIYFEKVIKE